MLVSDLPTPGLRPVLPGRDGETKVRRDGKSEDAGKYATEEKKHETLNVQKLQPRSYKPAAQQHTKEGKPVQTMTKKAGTPARVGKGREKNRKE